MKLIRGYRKNKGLFLTLLCVLGLSFVYGCQCEGGIDTATNVHGATKTITVQPESK